jgi:LacI family transcriptional regulator
VYPVKKNRKPKTTQNDVARHAGVTRSMVSYVINGSDRSVAPVTRQKILDAIKELGYRPNKFAQA